LVRLACRPQTVTVRAVLRRGTPTFRRCQELEGPASRERAGCRQSKQTRKGIETDARDIGTEADTAAIVSARVEARRTSSPRGARSTRSWRGLQPSPSFPLFQNGKKRKRRSKAAMRSHVLSLAALLCLLPSAVLGFSPSTTRLAPARCGSRCRCPPAQRCVRHSSSDRGRPQIPRGNRTHDACLA